MGRVSAKFWVLSMEASARRAKMSTQRVTLSLTPRDRRKPSQPLLIVGDAEPGSDLRFPLRNRSPRWRGDFVVDVRRVVQVWASKNGEVHSGRVGLPTDSLVGAHGSACSWRVRDRSQAGFAGRECCSAIPFWVGVDVDGDTSYGRQGRHHRSALR